MALTKMIDGVRIDLTRAEEAEFEASQRERVVEPENVRAEADRLITALVGATTSRQKDIRISNATREAVKLLRVGEENWTKQQAERAAFLERMDNAIDAIRVKSNELEAMKPIPLDFADDF